MKDIVLTKVREQEQYLLRLRDNLIRLNMALSDSKSFMFERAKFIGMLDVLDAMGVDRSEFNWIFKI